MIQQFAFGVEMVCKIVAGKRAKRERIVVCQFSIVRKGKQRRKLCDAFLNSFLHKMWGLEYTER